jgi:hypothetical protein
MLYKKKLWKPPSKLGRAKRREIPHGHKPEEQGGMPQHRHWPPAKHRKYMNLKYPEDKDDPGTLIAHPSKNFERD